MACDLVVTAGTRVACAHVRHCLSRVGMSVLGVAPFHHKCVISFILCPPLPLPLPPSSYTVSCHCPPSNFFHPTHHAFLSPPPLPSPLLSTLPSTPLPSPLPPTLPTHPTLPYPPHPYPPLTPLQKTSLMLQQAAEMQILKEQLYSLGKAPQGTEMESLCVYICTCACLHIHCKHTLYIVYICTYVCMYTCKQACVGESIR